VSELDGGRTERHSGEVPAVAAKVTSNVTASLASRAAQRLLRLSQPLSRSVTVVRDVAIPMPDGVVLLADRYLPEPAASPAPTVLVRTPYGRRPMATWLYGRPLAERGFHVVVQSVRGTGGSGGGFVPQVNERADGLATVAWIRAQPWFDGRLATTGMSYLGYAQWAIADDANLDALCVQVSMPAFDGPAYDGGAFALGLNLAWAELMSRRGARRRNPLKPLKPSPELEAGLTTLPLREGDRVATGEHVGFYQDWLAHRPGDAYWAPQSHTDRVPAVTAPVSMRTGWYDVFLPWMLRDYAALAAAGNPPRLTIGPWRHLSPGLLRGVARETVDFLSEQLLGTAPRPGGPVRYFVTGAGEWRYAETWPPAGTVERQWTLRAAGELLSADGGSSAHPGPVPPEGSASRFTYDPADPTPSVGGPALGGGSAVADNRALEHRSDVLVFTSLPLAAPVDVIGTPTARILVSSDNPNHDLFVRICDVDPEGQSRNVSDRLIRLDDVPFTDGPREAVLELWPLAHRFATGHRIRVQVSGGAFPRWARNPGTGEPPATATRLVPQTVSVHHDTAHPSFVILPVVPPSLV
jgi:uncharacterized protein